MDVREMRILDRLVLSNAWQMEWARRAKQGGSIYSSQMRDVARNVFITDRKQTEVFAGAELF